MVEAAPAAAGSKMRSWGIALVGSTLVFGTLVLVPYVQPSTMRSPLHHLGAVALHLAPGEGNIASSDGVGGRAQPADHSSSAGPPARAHPPLLAPRQPEQREKQAQKKEQNEEHVQEQQNTQQTKQQKMQEEPPSPQPRQQHPPPQWPQPLPQPPPADQQQAAARQEAKSPAVKMQPIVEPLEDPEQPQEPEVPPAVASSAEDWEEGMAFHAPQSGCTVQPNGEQPAGAGRCLAAWCVLSTPNSRFSSTQNAFQPLPLCCALPQPHPAPFHRLPHMPLPFLVSSLPGRVEYDPAPVPASGMPFLFDTSGLPSRESTCGADIDKGRKPGRCFG
jgi:hypothetical protein